MRLLSLLLLSTSAFAQTAFFEKPYLQLGNAPKLSSSETLALLWHTDTTEAAWTVEVKTSKDKNWRAQAIPAFQTVNAPGTPAHRVYRVTLTNLVPGEPFQYRVSKAGESQFGATGHARKSAGQPFRLVLFGDCAQDTPSQRAIAYQTSLLNPDFLFITGDIVYGAGRVSEYKHHFFPVYNPDKASPEGGAPLTRSIPFIAAPGNHDTAVRNFERFPDAMAYFLYWDQPLNGPSIPTGLTLNGTAETKPPFESAAAPRFPQMANFSFDYGNAHWTVLDSNPYVDWTRPELRAWVEKDLASAKNATWRFVAYHHPGFNSAKEHFTDQWMRVLAPVFEAGNVDIVFSGHVHNYQRSFPLTFAPKAGEDGKLVQGKGLTGGEWTLDKAFKNGETAKPKGVLYIVSGAGGAALYNPEQQADPASWQPFTDKFISTTHSLSQIDIDGKTFKLKQISEEGKEVDSFVIRK